MEYLKAKSVAAEILENFHAPMSHEEVVLRRKTCEDDSS
jgi:hypothetical protein